MLNRATPPEHDTLFITLPKSFPPSTGPETHDRYYSFVVFFCRFFSRPLLRESRALIREGPLVLGDLFKVYATTPTVRDPMTPASAYSSRNCNPDGRTGVGLFSVGFGGT